MTAARPHAHSLLRESLLLCTTTLLLQCIHAACISASMSQDNQSRMNSATPGSQTLRSRSSSVSPYVLNNQEYASLSADLSRQRSHSVAPRTYTQEHGHLLVDMAAHMIPRRGTNGQTVSMLPDTPSRLPCLHTPPRCQPSTPQEGGFEIESMRRHNLELECVTTTFQDIQCAHP